MDGYAGVRGAVEGGGTGCQQASTGAGHGLIRNMSATREDGESTALGVAERKKRDAVGGAKRAGGVAGPGTSRAGQQYFGHAARPQGSGRYRLGWAPRYRHVARLSWQLRRGPRPPAGARAERSVSLPRGDSPPSGSDHGRVDWAPTADYVIPVETAQIEWRIVQTASGVSRPL